MTSEDSLVRFCNSREIQLFLLLDRYEMQLHTSCDYVMKNFGIRQNARAEEVEALQQAKQILSGAMAN